MAIQGHIEIYAEIKLTSAQGTTEYKTIELVDENAQNAFDAMCDENTSEMVINHNNDNYGILDAFTGATMRVWMA